MGRRGPRPKGSRNSHLRPSGGIGAVGGKEDREKLDSARERVGGDAGRAFFDRFTDEFQGWSAGERELLVQGSREADLIAEADADIQENGILVDGARGGKVRNPAVLVRKGALASLRAILKDLRLDEAESW